MSHITLHKPPFKLPPKPAPKMTRASLVPVTGTEEQGDREPRGIVVERPTADLFIRNSGLTRRAEVRL